MNEQAVVESAGQQEEQLPNKCKQKRSTLICIHITLTYLADIYIAFSVYISAVHAFKPKTLALLVACSV